MTNKKSSSKKIIFYIKDLRGGPGRNLECFYEALTKNDFTILILSHSKNDNYNFDCRKIGYFTKKQKSFSLISLVIFILNLISLCKEIKKFKPNIIVSFDIYANLSTSLLKIFFPKIKYIYSTSVNLERHIYDERNLFFSHLLKFLIIFFYKRADFHFTPSYELTKQMINKFYLPEKKITTLPCAVDIKKIKILSNMSILDIKLLNLFRDKKTIKLFSMGRFVKQKNFELLLESFAILVKRGFKIRLFILGEGTFKNDYLKKIERLGIKDQTFFLGWKNNPFKYLRFANIFILLTRYEGLPYSLIETSALGVYSLSSDVDFGPQEILGKNHVGLIKNNLSARSVAEKIKYIIEKKIYIKEQPQIKIKAKKYDLSKLKGDYLEFFKGFY